MINDDIPLKDSLDVEILMHRDAHFSGSFDEMIAYYKKGGVGVNPEFPLEKLLFLQSIEKEQNVNLAPFFYPSQRWKRWQNRSRPIET